MSERHPAVFLDRDGTLISDVGNLSRPENIRLFPDTVSALDKLQKKYLLFVITNQSGIARGEITLDQANTVNASLAEILSKEGIKIQEWYVCPHGRTDNCECMKPRPGFVLQAAEDFGLDLSRSFMIGDHPHDVMTANDLGVFGLYVLTGHGTRHLPELPGGKYVFHGIGEAAGWILHHPSPLNDIQSQILRGAREIREGKTVAFPTETVYGLGADAFNPRAVELIYSIKNRPRNNPLIVHICDPAQVELLSGRVPLPAKKLMKAYWPGPLTVVLPKKREVPAEVTAGSDTVAVRMPDHPIALELIRQAGTPIAAPSANAFGCTSPTTALHVFEQLGARCGTIIDGGACRVGVESTVITFAGPVPEILRPGGLSAEEIRDVIGSVIIRGEKPSGIPQSPGLLPSHYAPETPLRVLDHIPLPEEVSADTGVLLLSDPEFFYPGPVEVLGGEGDLKEAAVNLYRAIRRLDSLGLRLIVTHKFPDRGLGTAINDRLKKASGGRV